MKENLINLIDAYAHAKAVHAKATIENAAVTGDALAYADNELWEVLDELIEADDKLRKLENGGVDNWEWYDEAMSAD